MDIQIDKGMVFEHTKHNFFQNLEKIKKEQIFPSKLTVKFMHKRWKNEFINQLIELHQQKQILRDLQELTIRNSHLTNEDLIMILDNLEGVKLRKMDLTSNSNTINNDSFNILQNHECLDNMKVLVLKNNQRIDDQAFLIENRNLLNLEVLDLENTTVTEQGLESFMKQLKQLKQIYIGKNSNINDLLFLDSMQQIQKLDISTCKLTEKGFENLSENKINNSLEEINISNIFWKVEFMKYFFKENRFNNLKKLDVNNCKMRDNDFSGLFEQQNLKSLVSLDLSVNKLGDSFIKSIRNQKESLNRLQELQINDCQLSFKAIKYLSQQPFPNLKYLNLGNNSLLKDESLLYLESLLISSQLEVLNLQKTGLTEIGITQFSKIEGLNKLTQLNLSNNNYISDEGCKILLQSPHLCNLQFLNLSNCWLTNQSIQYFEHFASIDKLVDLRLSENQINTKGIEDLVKVIDKFVKLQRFAGGYYCNEAFEGQEKLDEREILYVSYFGDHLD